MSHSRSSASEIVALIGPNGAGKTTCFNLIAGALKPTSGSVFLDGEDITGRAPEAIAVRGLIRTFQIVRPMRGMTVLENVMMGAFAATSDVAVAADIAAKALSRIGLAGKANDRRRAVSRCRIARCWSLRAHSLPARASSCSTRSWRGCDRRRATRIVALVRELHAGGMTVLLIEHVMRVVMALAGRVIVLHHGEKLAEGTPAEIGANPTGDRELSRNEGETGMTALLEVRDLEVSYGHARALNGVSIAVARGSLTAVVGVERRGQDLPGARHRGHAAAESRRHPLRR